MQRLLLLAVVAGLIFLVARLFRRVRPDECLVFFSGGKKPAVRSIRRSGLVFAPPGSRVSSLHLGAVTFTLNERDLGAGLTQPLRFLAGAAAEGRGLLLAAERLSGLTPAELAGLARSTALQALAGARPTAPNPAAEKNLVENLRAALAAKGFNLLSCNVDGLFGLDPAAPRT